MVELVTNTLIISIKFRKACTRKVVEQPIPSLTTSLQINLYLMINKKNLKGGLSRKLGPVILQDGWGEVESKKSSKEVSKQDKWLKSVHCSAHYEE